MREMQGDGESVHAGIYKLLVIFCFGVHSYSKINHNKINK